MLNVSKHKMMFISLFIWFIFSLRYTNYLTIIVGKESPFLEPLKETINKMKERGILNDIKNRYETPEKTECDESKVSNRFRIIIIFITLELVTTVIEIYFWPNVLNVVLDSHSSGWWFFPPKIWDAIIEVGLKKLMIQME